MPSHSVQYYEKIMQWEYKIERLKPEKKWGADETIEPLQDCLEKMGKIGWELISVTHHEGMPYVLFFKRPRVSPSLKDNPSKQ